MKFSKEELHDAYEEQNGEVSELSRKLDEKFPFKYFLNYSVSGKERANINRVLHMHHSHSIKVAREVRAHFLPLLFIPVNGERTHLHAQGRSDVKIPIQTFRRHWGGRTNGFNVFRKWDDEKDGETYFFGENQWNSEIYTYCGCNKQPCRSKKGQHCIHKNILEELREK